MLGERERKRGSRPPARHGEVVLNEVFSLCLAEHRLYLYQFEYIYFLYLSFYFPNGHGRLRALIGLAGFVFQVPECKRHDSLRK